MPNNLESGPSQQNEALLDVYESVARLSEGGVVIKNTAGQFLVFSKNNPPADPANPTATEALSAVNLSLALKEANWAYFKIDEKLHEQLLALKGASHENGKKLAAIREFSTGGFKQDASDPRGVLQSEVDGMRFYTINGYRKINAFLRGESSHTLHQADSTKQQIQLGEIQSLLANALLGLHGADKNRFLESQEPTKEAQAANTHNIAHNQPLIRLLSDTPPGLRAKLVSITDTPVGAPSFQSWTYFETGSPVIQDRKVFRLHILSAEGQRPLHDLFGNGSEGEVLYPATHYRVVKVALGEHRNPKTGETMPIIDVFVERIWGVSTESVTRYYTLDALSVSYQNHLRHPYTQMKNYQEFDVYRPNHALAHHVRVTHYIDAVVDYFAQHATDELKTYCKNLNHRDLEKLRVFMAFSRSGRETENDFGSNQEGYKKELKASADNFKSFVLARKLMDEEEANLWCRVLQDMGNPLFDRGIDVSSREDLKDYDSTLTEENKKTAKKLHAIFNLAHKLDLPRCFNRDQYAHAVFPYRPLTQKELLISQDDQKPSANKLVPYTEEAQAAFEAMEKYAQGCIHATGESMTHWNADEQRDKEKFIACNTDVLKCWDVCNAVALTDKVVSEVKPFLDKLDKVLLVPAIYAFYQRLTKLGVADFPSDEIEMADFLNRCFSDTPVAGITKENIPFLFNDMPILIYILRSQKIEDDIKKQVYSQVNFNELINTADELISLFQLTEEELNAAQRTLIWNTVKDKLGTIIQDGYQLRVLFSLLDAQLNAAQRTQIWDAVKDKLGTIIQNGYQLMKLFSLPEVQLNAAQRTQIWGAVKDNLGAIIKNGVHLMCLFSLPAAQLNAAQRTQIWGAVKDNLSAIIQNGDQLMCLFSLPEAQLNAAQRTQIMEALKDNLGTIIQDDYQLKVLFSLPDAQLNAAQRTLIWSAVEDKLGTIIQDCDQLKNLFSLSDAQLNAEQRTLIWSAVEDKLGTIIQNYNQLKGLFSLSDERLNAAQRTQIMEALKDKLSAIIQNGYQLMCLFSLPDERLNAAQRTQIMEALKDKLGTIIQNGHQLMYLFSLPDAQLNAAQRTQIWDAVKDKLGTIIQDGYELRVLFSLPDAQLNAAQRTLIWGAVKDNLGTIIQNGYELMNLFSLPEAQLNAAQRTLIWGAVKDNLGAIIKDGYQIMKLFSLSDAQLNAEQRTLIWDAVKDNFSAIIQNGRQFMSLFLLPEVQLNAAQRTQILNTLDLKKLAGTTDNQTAKAIAKIIMAQDESILTVERVKELLSFPMLFPKPNVGLFPEEYPVIAVKMALWLIGQAAQGDDAEKLHTLIAAMTDKKNTSECLDEINKHTLEDTHLKKALEFLVFAVKNNRSIDVAQMTADLNEAKQLRHNSQQL